MKLVLDTSALLSGMDFAGDVYLPTSVMREARKRGLNTRMESFIEARARVLEPEGEELGRVRKASRETGDEGSLSQTDKDVLALALQLDAVIVTDDYSIQNVASRLGIAYHSAVLPGIRKELGWDFRCTGCGRHWHEKVDPCPVCGSRVRRYHHQG